MLSVAAWGQDPPGSLSAPVQKKDPTVFAEELPPVSRGNLYSAAQIRYCLAESIRIEAVREVLDKSEPGSVDEFNAKIADFNGRCSSYRFYESEMSFVKREVDDHRARLQADARDEYLQRVAARKAERTHAQATPRSGAAEAAPSKPSPQPEPAASALPAVPREATQPTAQAAERPTAPPAPPMPPVAPQAPSESARSAPPLEAPAPIEAAAPEQPEPQPAEEQPERAKAAAPSDDAAITRYVKEIQRVGSRVLDDRQVPEAARVKSGSGTAQIEVRFSAGGFIRSIVLAQSSGRAEFDAHALTIARGIMFPHVPRELASRDFTARFPIAFKPRKPR